jgi:hypothetical protein
LQKLALKVQKIAIEEYKAQAIRLSKYIFVALSLDVTSVILTALLAHTICSPALYTELIVIVPFLGFKIYLATNVEKTKLKLDYQKGILEKMYDKIFSFYDKMNLILSGQRKKKKKKKKKNLVRILRNIKHVDGNMPLSNLNEIFYAVSEPAIEEGYDTESSRSRDYMNSLKPLFNKEASIEEKIISIGNIEKKVNHILSPLGMQIPSGPRIYGATRIIAPKRLKDEALQRYFKKISRK